MNVLIVFSQTNLSAKNGKLNLYTPETTSSPVTGESTLENVLLEKSTIEIEVIIVRMKPIPKANLKLFEPLNEIELSSELGPYLNKNQEGQLLLKE